MKKILIVLVIVILSEKTYSQLTQSIDDLEQYRLKYWYYRERLKNDFMLGIGTNFGESLPASIRKGRDENYDCCTTISWGDATIDLAQYIAVLATEYRLLANNNQSTYEVLRELYYAIEAFNRLDYYAETYDDSNAPCCDNSNTALNGFFVRSDVGRGLFVDQSTTHTSLYNTYLQKLNHNDPNQANWEVDKISSEWTNFHIYGDKNLFFESIDQVVYLLDAFSYVKELINPGVTWTELGNSSPSEFLDQATDEFHEEAKLIIRRIIDYIHEDSNPIQDAHTWDISRPSGPHVGLGYDCWQWAKGLSDIYSLRTGEDNPDLQHTLGQQWHNAITTFSVQWQFYGNIYGITNDAKKEGKKFLSLATSGNSFTSSSYDLYSRAHQWPDNSVYNLTGQHNVLNDEYDVTLDLDSYELLLFAEAPCHGPYNYGNSNGGASSFHWSSTSLLIHPESRGDGTPDNPGEYNGLDYMLLFNLNELNKYGIHAKYYYNHYNTEMSRDYPFTYQYISFNPYPHLEDATIGNDANPFKANVYNTITANNQIASNGNVYYRAGEYIDLQTNFDAQPGSEFIAIADNVECEADSITLFRYANTNSGSSLIPADDKNKTIPSTLKASIFPIPSSENLNLKLDVPETGNLIIELFDLMGKKAATLFNANIQHGEFFLTYPINDLPAGIYHCVIKLENDQKVIKINISN